LAKERLIIARAGNFGRELISWAMDCHEAGRLPPIGGFIDEVVQELPGIPRLGGFYDYAPRAGDLFLICTGEPAVKKGMVESLRERGARFASLIHPTVVLGRTAKHGVGMIMCPYSMNTVDCVAGDFVTMLSFSGLAHDCVAGDFTTISTHVDVMGHVTLGSEVFVGSGARIMPHVRIGDRARIGAGAVVVRNVKPDSTVFTAPAKVLRSGG
jgi:sugar O-acyltransferase (sialic acid O-acetyltransferase NeuD family)